MALHLLKLCVGCDSIADLEGWIEENRLLHARLGRPYRQVHTTRQTPRRASEMVPGGSLYWVIKGQISARQRLLALESSTGADGILRAQLVLEPVVMKVVPRACRPFQGWRYLSDADAPPDVAGMGEVGEMPEKLRAELAALKLL